MNDQDFNGLCESIRQAGEIKDGTRKPSRVFKHTEPDVRKIRERLGLSQSRFAAMIGVSPRTVQNWEQKRREPKGPAKALLRFVEQSPRVVLESLHSKPKVNKIK